MFRRRHKYRTYSPSISGLSSRVAVQRANSLPNHRSGLDAPILLAMNTTSVYNVLPTANPPRSINLLLTHLELSNKTRYQSTNRIGEQMKNYYYWKGVRYTDWVLGQISQITLEDSELKKRSEIITRRSTWIVQNSHYQNALVHTIPS